jgi:hypothetical protein
MRPVFSWEDSVLGKQAVPERVESFSPVEV